MSPLEVLAHLGEVGTPPDAGVALKMSVGLSKTLSRLKSETFPFLAAGGAELQFVYGAYGRGKTHFLKSVEKIAQQHGLVTAYVDCRTGQSPFLSFKDTYSLVASALNVNGVKLSSANEIGVPSIMEKKILDLGKISARNLMREIQRSPYQVPDYRNLVCAFGLNALKDEPNELREALEALLLARGTYRVTVGELYRVYPELPRPIGKLNRRNAGPWLRSLISLPHVLGYPGVVILFDETERTFQGRGRKTQQLHLATLRNFVDYMAVGAFRGCAVYYAVVEEFIEFAREHLNALSQRIERLRLPGEGAAYSNSRAVWVDLNELTSPSPAEPVFFTRLAEKILRIGREAGLPDEKARVLARELEPLAVQQADSIYEGAVREFVKLAAKRVAEQVLHHA